MGNGAKRTRTAGPLNAIEVLYQLSYSPPRPFTIMTYLLPVCQVLGEIFFSDFPRSGLVLEGKRPLGAAFGPLLFFDNFSEDHIK